MLRPRNSLQQPAPVCMELQFQRMRLPIDLEFPVRGLVDNVQIQIAVM